PPWKGGARGGIPDRRVKSIVDPPRYRTLNRNSPRLPPSPNPQPHRPRPALRPHRRRFPQALPPHPALARPPPRPAAHPRHRPRQPARPLHHPPARQRPSRRRAASPHRLRLGARPNRDENGTGVIMINDSRPVYFSMIPKPKPRFSIRFLLL